jgi:hypothetical protein
MSTAKVIKIVASSEASFDDAVKKGLAQAGKTLHGISGAEVENWTVDVENNKVVRYKVTMHIAFALDE